MICSYCKKEKKVTGEHLIPQALLDTFPECDFNLRQGSEYKAFKGDRIVINDVCGHCNGVILSELDAYGSKMVNNYFVQAYEPEEKLKLLYDYPTLSRWLLKLLFNVARAEKDIASSVIDSNVEYILGKSDIPITPFSIFGGLSIDMTPLPEYWNDNIKLGVYLNPILIRTSLLEKDSTSRIRIRNNSLDIKLPNLQLSGLLKFGSGLFLVFLWKENTSPKEIKEMEELITTTYPYAILESSLGETTLRRVTHAYNFNNFQMIDTTLGMEIADETNCFMPKSESPIETRKAMSQGWDQFVSEKRENRASRRQRDREKKKNRQKSE